MASASSVPRIVGRYVLHDPIASGGMASVHLGHFAGAMGFSRMVAIKRLHAHFAHDPDFRAMFVDEARLAARIHHPNVVQTLDVVTEGSELFVVMEYVEGDSLASLMRKMAERKERLSPRIAVAILIGVLHGLHAAHEACSAEGEALQLVHRDVSPPNILIDVGGVARVLDFGVAKAEGRLQTTNNGMLKGKIAYMAPEQLTGGELDRRSDLYACGVVLWEALTGKRLFRADSTAALITRVMEGCAQPPSQWVADLDPRLDAIVSRALARSKEDRFVTALDMALALESLGLAAPTSEVASWMRELSSSVLEGRAHIVAAIEGRSMVVPTTSRSAPNDELRVSVDEPPTSLQPRVIPGANEETTGTHTYPRARVTRSRVRHGALLVGAGLLAIVPLAVFAWHGSPLGAGQRAESDLPSATATLRDNRKHVGAIRVADNG